MTKTTLVYTVIVCSSIIVLVFRSTMERTLALWTGFEYRLNTSTREKYGMVPMCLSTVLHGCRIALLTRPLVCYGTPWQLK